MKTGKNITVTENITVTNDTFKELFLMQQLFQHRVAVTDKPVTLPCDNPTLFQYHMTAMTEEMGEVLKADKRWKTHRNTAHNPEEKLDEIADCFITMMNVAMWSGFSNEDIYEAIKGKIEQNNKRLDKEK